MKKILVIAVMICFYLTSFGQKYLAAARQGDAEAQYQLGNCYYYGKDGVKEDGKKAVKWYRKAAKQGHASAQCMLGCCYQYEVGVKKDNQKAAELYQKSAEQGNAEALWNLGDLYFEGAGVEKDIAKGVELFQSSAELGFTKAQLHLAHLYEEGEGVPKDYVKMAEWYGKAAEQGDFNGQCFLALCYLEGEGVTKDLAKAINLLQKASDKGHPTAQATLGKCYFKGEGVRKNYDKAVKLFQKAYTSDDEAKYYLGICYLGGYGIDRNRDNALALFQSAVRKFDKAKYLIATMDDVAFGGKDKALKFLNDAADQGKIDDLDAEVLYLVGSRWAPDEYSAFDRSECKVGEKWLLKAAEKGYIEAQYKLSKLYKRQGNEPKRFEWLQKAAEQGHDEAIDELGRYYYDDVKYLSAALRGDAEAQFQMGDYYFWKDKTKAIEWYLKSAEQGNNKAMHRLIGAYEEIDEAKAKEWESKALAADKIAAENGDVEAIKSVAYAYGYESGDWAEAAKWYRKGAEKGDASCQTSLGLCYENGKGVKIDYAEAAKWYRKAAEQGDGRALAWLGDCYEKGMGVTKNTAEALRLYRKAVNHGYKSAEKYFFKLACGTQYNQLKKKYGAATVDAMMKTGEIKIGHTMAFLNEYTEFCKQYLKAIYESEGKPWIESARAPRIEIYEPTIQQMTMYGRDVRVVKAFREGFLLAYFYIKNGKVVGVRDGIFWKIDIEE